MAACGTYYRTSLRRVRRNFRDDISRELAKTRLESDSESLEWMNSFLVKFWPIYAPNLAESIIASVDQVLSTSTPAFLDSMRLRTFILGTKPPRMEHVKTYPKTEDDIVLMDWKFSFTPTDIMDMTARQLKVKINPKVVLEIRIGKAMISKAMDVIVEDFAFSGLLRVRFKLQLAFPHVEKIDISFIGRPDIDYVCKPLGGETLGFDINFIPGLESFIKEQIHASLAPMMYDPNVFPIEIAKMLSGNPVDLAIGVVAVTIHGAQSLKNPDKFSGTPDPYAVVSLNSRSELGRTKTVTENANPRWNETVYIIITNYTDVLTLQMYDFNEYRKDKELGTASFPLEKLEQVPEHENLQLEVISSGKSRGQVQADVRFFPVLQGQKLDDGTVGPPPESNTGIARITIEQCKELDGSKSLVGQLNPYAVLLLNGKEIHVTKKLKRTNNPIFPDPTKSVLITDRKKARVGVVIKDDRDLATDPILGTYQIKVNDMISLMQKGQEWFHLSGTKTGRAKLSLDWKPVALQGISGGAGGYMTPIGVMRIHFQNARELRNLETIGKSDPYARVMLSGIEKGRTVTFQNNLNPDWDEVIYVPMHSTNERLILEVMDTETHGSDRSLGLTEVRASEFIHESEDGGYEVHDGKALVSDDLRMSGKGTPKGKLNYTVAFYPTLNVIDPEEEEEEQKAQAEMENKAPSDGKQTPLDSKPSLDAPRSLENGVGVKPRASLDTKVAAALTNGVKEEGASTAASMISAKKPPKVRINVEDLGQYRMFVSEMRKSFANHGTESGLIIFNIIEGTFAATNVQLEVLIDDNAFPSYVTSKARQKVHQFNETGDAFVRELDMSQMTLRLNEKTVKDQDEEESEEFIAQLKGQTLLTLQQCLYKPTELTLKSKNGALSKVVVKLRYLPVKMQLDPSESINNSGTLRVDVLDAVDLPSADRNGFSDPYCKFRLNDKEVYKTKVQKKTLHPAWNEFFEVPVPSRTAANFTCSVYDWDFGDKADHLGATKINLAALEPFRPHEGSYPLDGKSGTIRLKMLFKPAYVTRRRQGTSTFSGTFAPAGKVVGAPVKVVGGVGGGMVKGASFLKRGFTRSSKASRDEPMDPNGTVPEVTEPTPINSPEGTPVKAAALTDGAVSPSTPSLTPHNRSRSFGSNLGGAPKGAETGTANVTVVSATGYPVGADVRVYIKMIGGKGAKEVHKTKAIKSSSGKVEYALDHETFKVACSADTQFQVVVKDHGTLREKDLGEGLFFVSDQGSGAEHAVSAGEGIVVLKSSFTAAGGEVPDDRSPGPASGRNSPDSRRDVRRSLFGRKEKHDT